MFSTDSTAKKFHAERDEVRVEVMRTGRGYVQRAKRFDLTKPLRLIVRPKGARAYSFWMEASNISTTGLYIYARPNVIVPFTTGTVLEATVDLSCMIFERPLHMVLTVARVSAGNKAPMACQGLGTKIESVDSRHVRIFWNGMEAFGKADVVE